MERGSSKEPMLNLNEAGDRILGSSEYGEVSLDGTAGKDRWNPVAGF